MALMKHVAVCSPDISKLIYQISCKLGAIGFSKMLEQKYGIASNCEDNEYTELKLYLEVFKKLQKVEITDNNVELNNIIKDLQLINNCDIKEKCLTNIIERVKDILQNCSDCNNYTPAITYTTLDSWYETQEYIECLQNEFEENGYLDYVNPIINLCTGLNINIDANKLCQDLIVVLNANKIACDLVSTINVTNICNLIQMDNMLNVDINANTLCDLVLKDIKGELPICDINIDINTNEVNGCSYTPICVDEPTCVIPLITITNNTCECVDNNIVETPGVVTVITPCEDNLIYSVDGITWTSDLPDYDDFATRIYYKCECENGIHIAFKNTVVCEPTYVGLTPLCKYYSILNGLYTSSYHISGNISNLLVGSIILTPPNAVVTYDLIGSTLIFYNTDELIEQIEIPVVCGESIILTDIFEQTTNDIYDNTPQATVEYSCELDTITVVANGGYNVSNNLINWESGYSIIDTNFPIIYYVREIDNPGCIRSYLYTPLCCQYVDCNLIVVDVSVFNYSIINSNSGCEYILDFYVDDVKVHTEGFGNIYDASIENPYNLTLNHIVNSYCGTIENPVIITPILRELQCGDSNCTPMCPLPPISRACINICALPTIAGHEIYYETGLIMNNQTITYTISSNTTLQIMYNMYIVSDSIEVYYNGYLVQGNYDLVGIGTYTVPIVYVTGVDLVTVKYIPNQLLPTKAMITVSCLREYICNINTDCLSLNTLDDENPIISLIPFGCNNILTVTLPIIELGNSIYNDCAGNAYGLIQANSVTFDINDTIVCEIDREENVYLCNADNFQATNILVTNIPNEKQIFISDTILYLSVKNFINTHSCNNMQVYNHIVIDLVNTESTACNTDCVDDINCNIYTTYPIYIYPCYSTVTFNDNTNTITITVNTLPTLSVNSCNCEYRQVQELLINSSYTTGNNYYYTVDRLSYWTVLGLQTVLDKSNVIYNVTTNNINIEGCEVESMTYYITYLCEDNSVNSVRIYKKDNTINNLYALTYQGSIIWTDGRIVDSNNYIYTEGQIQTNTGTC